MANGRPKKIIIRGSRLDGGAAAAAADSIDQQHDDDENISDSSSNSMEDFLARWNRSIDARQTEKNDR